eukprot:s482_g23.t1
MRKPAVDVIELQRADMAADVDRRGGASGGASLEGLGAREACCGEVQGKHARRAGDSGIGSFRRALLWRFAGASHVEESPVLD